MTDHPVVSTSTASMSSKEIAELTDKRHDHVLRDIRVMLEQLHDDENKSIMAEKDWRGYTACYHIPFAYALTLISGYDAKSRLAIFQRFSELTLKAALSDFDFDDVQHDRFVYVAVENKSGRYKIGISKRPTERVKDLSRMHPEGLTLIALYDAKGVGYQSEKEAHKALQDNRIKGEWFDSSAPVHQLNEFLDATVN